MNKIALHVIILLAFLFSGCAVKTPISSSNSYLVTIKNKQIALADTGFLNHGKDYTNLQIFSAGSILFNLEITQNVCLDGRCTDKLEFNRLFFENEHYEGMINDILNMQPLYNGKSMAKIEGGFEQDIVLPKSHIIYKIEHKSLYFKDSQNGILIKLKEFK